ncbi:hypothetical protein BLNAU_5937 [Blattamonas nauphoetae]|uniref:Uncharacterized protein n=1 Tax=Blattamonas nauphoetae TaxID=2049346 RepID=A0ABQ9Y5W4_9EUKA|nr:hypothetical protein BLNAU_5937 [Blattamonas nauphoetae]
MDNERGLTFINYVKNVLHSTEKHLQNQFAEQFSNRPLVSWRGRRIERKGKSILFNPVPSPKMGVLSFCLDFYTESAAVKYECDNPDKVHNVVGFISDLQPFSESSSTDQAQCSSLPLVIHLLHCPNDHPTETMSLDSVATISETYGPTFVQIRNQFNLTAWTKVPFCVSGTISSWNDDYTIFSMNVQHPRDPLDPDTHTVTFAVPDKNESQQLLQTIGSSIVEVQLFMRRSPCRPPKKFSMKPEERKRPPKVDETPRTSITRTHRLSSDDLTTISNRDNSRTMTLPNYLGTPNSFRQRHKSPLAVSQIQSIAQPADPLFPQSQLQSIQHRASSPEAPNEQSSFDIVSND